MLASGSPRRADLLRYLGMEFTVMVPQVDEASVARGGPRAVAMGRALLKAGALEGQVPVGTLVLAVDTVVALDGVVYDKPEDVDDARRMLRAFAGREHEVISGIALHEGGRSTEVDAVRSFVRFRDLTDAEIEEYLACGEWTDKAGGYGIQGRGGDLVAQVSGEFFNVVGLPVDRMLEMLGAHKDVSLARRARMGLTPEAFRRFVETGE